MSKAKTTQINMRIPAHLKKKLEATGNVSAYLRSSAEKRLAACREAQTLLEQAGWKRNETLALMDLLNGTILSFTFSYSEMLVHEMEDGASLDGVHTKWGITEERWEEMKKMVRQEPIARAIVVLKEEFWDEASDHVNL